MAIPFNEKELEVVRVQHDYRGDTPIYSFPVKMREALLATMLDRKPIWQLTGIETRMFMPSIHPDNVARALVIENKPFDALTMGGGKDMFGIQWDYIPVANGSMERPGTELFDDVNEWQDKVVFPDVDSWDWEGSAEMNKDFFNDDQAFQAWFQTGWFERLISFMGFEDAAVALMDEDQQDAVRELLDKVSDTYIDIIDHYVKYFPNVYSFYMHDDWGSQKETFFNPDLVEETIVPAMKKVTDHIHSLGRVAELHSCGQIMRQVPNMIKAGWDTWSGQPMNDSHALYEQYGDKIVLGVAAPEVDVSDPESKQRELAHEFVEKFCNPGKPCVMTFPMAKQMPNAFREEIYVRSRKKYAEI